MPRAPSAAPTFVHVILLLPALAACGHADPPAAPAIEDPSSRRPTADVAELEIRGQGVDRFASCPPPGELGQSWIPPLEPLAPAELAAAASADADAGPREPFDATFIARTEGRSQTELAAEATHREFRACYERGLVHDPTQDGRAAIVVRIAPDGRVARVEEYAACELAPATIACMKAVAGRLRFSPPGPAGETLAIPAVFTGRNGRPAAPETRDDPYTAAAYVAIGAVRPALHRCEAAARRDLRPLEATGTFTLVVGKDGHVQHTHIDPFTGDRDLLVCAAKALETVVFAPPEHGDRDASGTVIARLNFNPRQGTR